MMDPESAFKKGDVVRKKRGTCPIKITSVSCAGSIEEYLYGEYLHSNMHTEDYAKNFIHMSEGEYTDPNSSQKENTMENTMNNDSLYQILARSPETYAKYLATNSAGKLVMEVQGTGEIVTVAKTDIEEVVPYTVGIKFLGGNTGPTYHYFSNKGDVDKGDIITVKGSTGIALVVELDTKSKSATKQLVGKKVEMTAFGGPDA